MPSVLRVFHRTEYRYDRPVAFGPHRMMLRPRDGHDLRVEDALLTISPHATLRWYFDAFGNSIGEATFDERSESLTIVSELLLRRYAAERRIAETPHPPTPWPFAYSEDDALDLFAYRTPQNPGEAEALTAWLDGVFPHRPDSALDFLRELADAINRSIRYSAREEMGTQSAAETIRSGLGTCRDFAFLFIEAARGFGFAARFVTGYLHDARSEAETLVGGGATHAWADVFIPGEGWIEFDPTNRIVAGAALIRVASTRTARQASPIRGSYLGADATFLGLDVSVRVSSDDMAA